MSPDITHLLWFDCETTGIDQDSLVVLEVAWRITKTDLTPIGTLHSELLVGECPNMTKHLVMPEAVRKMHTENGLLGEIDEQLVAIHDMDLDASDSILREATARKCGNRILASVIAAGVGIQKVALAGSGVERFDRFVIGKHMPLLHEWLPYWCIDVSTTRRLGEIWGAAIEAASAKSTHRAAADVENAIAVAREIRGLFP